MGVSKKNKKQEMGDTTTRQSAFLKVVHPRGYVELFREPITAGEIMRRYPRYYLARPDFFEYPWVVVRPESVLVPGKVFYLVPHRTIDKLLKEKKHERELMNPKPYQPPEKQYDHYQNHDRQEEGRTNQHSVREGQESDSGSLYRESFCESWEKMSRKLDSEADSPSDSSRLCFPQTRSGRPRVGSSERVELLRIKSCLRKADSVRKKVELRVSFASPLVIPGKSQSVQPYDLVSQLQTLVPYKNNSLLL